MRDEPDALVMTPTGDRDRFDVIDRDPVLDVALLTLSEGDACLTDDLAVIPRECWRGTPPADGRVLIQLCTEEADTPSSLEIRLRPAAPSARRVEFKVPEAREGVRAGSSGAPVVEMQAGLTTPRLLGLTRARDETTVDILDHAGTGWFVPMERIAERFAVVDTLIETPVERTAAWTSHWQPRARGVASSTDRGHFFSGREAACAAIRDHLDHGEGLAVVTAKRGHGKSAVLAHIVVGSCSRYSTLLGTSSGDDVARLGPGRIARRVDAAVLGRGHVSELAAELAEQLGFSACGAQELVDLVERHRLGCRIVIDGVDESPDPKSVMSELVVPLSKCAAIAIGALAGRIEWQTPSETKWIDLDEGPYGDDAVTPYVKRRLRASGTYSELAAARVAGAVANRAEGNFLVAELVSRVLAAREAIDTRQPRWREQLPTDVTDAFREYLGRFDSHQRRVLALLAPLAHAYGHGLTLPIRGRRSVWLAAANALRPDTEALFTDQDLREACERASDYLIVGGEGQARRLYHEGLAGTVRGLASADAVAASRVFVKTLVDLLPANLSAPAPAYERLDPYLLRHFPAHLADHRQADKLLERPGLLLAGDREALRAALVRGALAIAPEHEAARVAIVHALASPRSNGARRVAALCAALRRQEEHDLADCISRAAVERSVSIASDAAVPKTSGERAERLRYELISGQPLAPVLTALAEAHSGSIDALDALEHDGETLLISAGNDGAVRSWRMDGSPGPLQQPHAHRDWIKALVVLDHEGETLLISAGDDQAVRSWRMDGSPGPLQQTDAHKNSIRALAVLEHEGETLLISAGDDQAVRSWWIDGRPGPLQQPHAHRDSVSALAVLEHDGETLLISAGRDQAVRSWRMDGSPGPLQQPDAHNGWIRALAVLDHNGDALLISAGDDGALRSWRGDGEPGMLQQPEAHGAWINALVTLEHDSETLLISADYNHAVRSWRMDGSPGPLQVAEAHDGPVTALAVVEHDSNALIVSAGRDGALRFWRVDASSNALQQQNAHSGPIRALAVGRDDRNPLLVSAGDDRGLWFWHVDGSRGVLQKREAHSGSINALLVLQHDDRALLISAGNDAAVRSWRMDGSPGPLQQPHAHRDWIRALAVLEHDGETLLISAGDDGAVRSWRMDGSPGPLQVADAHDGPVTALAVLEHDANKLLMSASNDHAVRSWRMDGSPGPLQVADAHDGPVTALAVLEHNGETVLISAGADHVVRSWRVNRSLGAFEERDAHDDCVRALAVLDYNGEALLVSAGDDRTIMAHRAT